MATDNISRTLLTVFTTYPVVLDKTDTAHVYYSTLHQNIEAWAKVTGTSGLLYLLKWLPEANAGAGEWGVYRNPIILDPALPGGWCQGAWFQDRDAAAYYALLATGTITVSQALIQGVMY